MKKLIRRFLEFVYDSFMKLFSFDENKYLFLSFNSMPCDLPLGLVDVGAAGGLQPRWKKVESLLFYYGFEPDSRSSENLESLNSKRKIFPHALWEKTEKLTINLCKKPQVSSHFIPNRDLLDKFLDKHRFDISNKVLVEACRMDEINIEHADFIKLDIQGGELAVLKGATETLKRTFGLEVEVEFLEMYGDQPLFGEIVIFLREFGFEFIDFTSIHRWGRSSYNGLGQAIFGDALFLKTPELIVDENIGLDGQSQYLKILLLYLRFDLIDVFLNSMPTHDRQKFEAFEKNIRPIKKNTYRANYFSLLSRRLLRLFGGEYRSHLLY